MAKKEFLDRESAVLEEIIRYYLAHREAISARTLSKISELALSATTIRNLMEDLSEAGLLTTEGVTRGRVPTQKAFTLYVTRLKPEPPSGQAPQPDLAPLEEGRRADLADGLEQVGRFLARETGFVALAALPPRGHYPLDWVHFAPLRGNQVLVSMGTLFGDLWSKTLQATEPFPEELLREVNRYVNERYRGRSVSQVRGDIMAGEPTELLGAMPSFGAAMRLLRRAFEWDADGPPLVWGQEQLFGLPEFNERPVLRHLLGLLRDPGLLSRLQKRGRALEGGWVCIGTETGVAELGQAAVVGFPFGADFWRGQIAVLGPMGMDYARVIHLAAQSARVLSAHLAEMLPSPRDRALTTVTERPA